MLTPIIENFKQVLIIFFLFCTQVKKLSLQLEDLKILCKAVNVQLKYKLDIQLVFLITLFFSDYYELCTPQLQC